MNTGVFTTIKITHGIPLFLERHLDRLLYQAKKLHLGNVDLSYANVRDYVKTNALSDCALKIILVKKEKKTVVLFQTRPLPETLSPIKLFAIPDTRDELKIYKTTDRLVNEEAQKQAKAKGADDALFAYSGNLIESTNSNVFAINKKGMLVTPNLNNKGLNGITREVIMKYVHVVEEPIPQRATTPLVLVNSLRIQYVTHLNGRPIDDSKPLLKIIQKALIKAESDYLATIS